VDITDQLVVDSWNALKPRRVELPRTHNWISQTAIVKLVYDNEGNYDTVSYNSAVRNISINFYFFMIFIVSEITLKVDQGRWRWHNLIGH